MEQNFCIDCKYCQIHTAKHKNPYHHCTYPGIADPVTGLRPRCTAERSETGHCGPDSVLFVPKSDIEATPTTFALGDNFTLVNGCSDRSKGGPVPTIRDQYRKQIADLRAEIYRLEAELLKSMVCPPELLEYPQLSIYLTYVDGTDKTKPTEKRRKQDECIHPVERFINAECTVGEKEEVKKSLLFGCYKKWCEKSGLKSLNKIYFLRELKHFANTTDIGCRMENGSRERFIGGISLASKSVKRDAEILSEKNK